MHCDSTSTNIQGDNFQINIPIKNKNIQTNYEPQFIFEVSVYSNRINIELKLMYLIKNKLQKTPVPNTKTPICKRDKIKKIR